MNKASSIIITIGLLIAIGIILFDDSKSGADKISGQAQNNVEIRDGIQYITIDAKGGYSPQNSVAKAGIPTKLILKTEGTYDCSSSVVIQSIDYQKTLSQTGEEIIDIGTPATGSPLQGTCGMGMYDFAVDFK